jgi:tRNA 2-thiouridine synthesizing protein A
MTEAVVIDARGLKCPLPVLKLERRLRSCPVGAHVTVLATDPLAGLDIPNFCREAGHRLLASEREEGAMQFEIETGPVKGSAR